MQEVTRACLNKILFYRALYIQSKENTYHQCRFHTDPFDGRAV